MTDTPVYITQHSSTVTHTSSSNLIKGEPTCLKQYQHKLNIGTFVKEDFHRTGGSDYEIKLGVPNKLDTQ